MNGRMESSDGARPFTWEEGRQVRRNCGHGEKLHLHRDPRSSSGKGRSAPDQPHRSAQQCPGHPTPAKWGITALTVTSPAPRHHIKINSVNPTLRSHKDQLGKGHLPLKEGWRSSPARPSLSAYPSKFLWKQEKQRKLVTPRVFNDVKSTETEKNIQLLSGSMRLTLGLLRNKAAGALRHLMN